MNEQEAIEQLGRYKQIQARIQVLSTYSVGAGITVSRLNQDDQLQELHRRLRRMPSYMYLGKRELQLEATAHAYLTRYPAGVKSQLAIIPEHGADEEDDKLLQELRNKIGKVIAARGYDIRDDLDAVLDRLTELTELQDEVNHIDTVLAAMICFGQQQIDLIRIHFLEGKVWNETAKEMGISQAVFYRWRKQALQNYVSLAK